MNTQENNKTIAQVIKTQQNNKMIAEFMKHSHPFLPSKSTINYLAEDLEYDNDWNWLMPVVDRIEDMGCEVVMTNAECTISGADNCDYYVESIGKNRRGTTYDAVVKFINQLNK